MTVYVDNMRAPYGRMIMCHMIADDVAELHEMVDKIGVSRRWFQDKPGREHYDISLAKRVMAVEAGAVEVTARELVRMLRARRRASDVLSTCGR